MRRVIAECHSNSNALVHKIFSRTLLVSYYYATSFFCVILQHGLAIEILLVMCVISGEGLRCFRYEMHLEVRYGYIGELQQAHFQHEF